MSAPRADRPRPDPRSVWGTLGLPLLGMLAIELLLGMALNLFTTLPTGSPASIVLSSPVLILHMVLGVLLVGITSRAVVLSARIRERAAISASVLGLVSVLVALLAGLSFTFGDQSNAASFGMAAGFTGAFISAGLILWLRGGPAGGGPGGTPDPASRGAA